MRMILWAAALVLVAAPILPAHADDTAEFLKPENWEGLEKFWKIDGTSVIGKATEDPTFNTFLCSKKKYADFEMSFKIRLVDGQGNSGVQVRSMVTNRDKFTVHGPQCDIGQQYWGSLYGEGVGGMMKASPDTFVKDHVKTDGFNDYMLRVVGNRFTIKINGEVSVDEEFPTTPNEKPTPAEGIIAFQLHQGGPMTVEFTDIVFKDLSKK